MIAVTFALREESEPFLKRVRVTDASGTGETQVLTGRLGAIAVRIAHIGVGAEAAGAGVRALLPEGVPDLLICTGFGGALNPQLKVGDLVIDWRTTPEQLKRYPLRGGQIAGAIATSRDALETPEQKAECARLTGAMAVDMETEAVAAVCQRAGVPLLALRAVSDAASQPLPVPMPHWFDLGRQRPKPAALLWYLARHPRKITPFVRFVRGLSPARLALAEFLSGFITAIEDPERGLGSIQKPRPAVS